MKKLIIYCLFLLLLFPPLYAMEGTGFAFRANLSGKIYKRLSFFIEEDTRFRSDFRAEWFLTTAEVNYRILPNYLLGGAGYMSFIQYKGIKDIRHRYYLYLTGSYNWGNFKVSIRERFQSTYTKGKSGSSNALRSRLKLSYKIGTSKFEPYFYIEPFNNTKKNMHTDKIRYSAGCTYQIDTHNSIELYYRYHTFSKGYYDTVNHRNGISIGYSFKF